MNLTIFQKMLVAPAVAMAVYCAYLYVMYTEYRQAATTIEAIRDDSLPVVELAGENVRLFDGLVTQMKDAVLAGEKEWLNNTEKNKEQIESNLLQMERYADVVPREQVAQLHESFRGYYRNAYALSQMLLGGAADSEKRNRLIEAVERDHSAVMAGLSAVKTTVNDHVHHAVEATTQRLHNILLMGVSVGVILAILVTVLTFFLSMTTRRSLFELIGRMRDLAEGHPDFSKRLQQHSKDELGELIGWFNLLSDKLEQDYKKIELLSITDKLTQLYNRTKIERLFDEELMRSERYGDVFSVILIDLDYFKAVNDLHGHLVGDRVLQELARLLRETVRNTEHVGRWGGEEFIIIAPKTGPEDALQLAEKVRQRIEAYPFPEVGHKTASIGLSSYRQGDTRESLTQRADESLYNAKAQGRNRVIGEEAA